MFSYYIKIRVYSFSLELLSLNCLTEIYIEMHFELAIGDFSLNTESLAISQLMINYSHRCEGLDT